MDPFQLPGDNRVKTPTPMKKAILLYVKDKLIQLLLKKYQSSVFMNRIKRYLLLVWDRLLPLLRNKRTQAMMDGIRTHVLQIFTGLVVILFAIIIGWGWSTESYGVLSGILLIGFLIILLPLEYRLVKKQSNIPVLMMFWILVQPLLRIFSIPAAIQIGTQLVSVGIFIYYFSLRDQHQRVIIWNGCKPILLVGFVFWGVLSLSFLSQPFSKNDLYFLIEIMSSFLFIFLPFAVCENINDVFRLMKVVVLLGLFQFLIVFLQAVGLADKLPAIFSQLYAANWGGALTVTTQGVRYPGSFGDFELLAEFAGLAFILSAGFALIESKNRLLWIIASSIIFVLGWLTGTRAFIVITAGGIAILFMSFLWNGQIKVNQFFRYLLVSIFIFVIVFSFIPNNVVNEFLTRFQDLQFTGSKAFNRAYFYIDAFSLLPMMPIWGYGASMWAVFQQAANVALVDPHSLYLWMLLFSGYPGLFITILFMVTIFLSAFWLSKQNHIKLSGPLGSVLFAAMAYLMVNETKIGFLRSYFYADILFFFFGIVVVSYQIGRRLKSQQET